MNIKSRHTYYSSVINHSFDYGVQFNISNISDE